MTQKQALELLKTGRNVFVTGPAGSGKTYLINSYIKYLKENDVEVGITASTGIAATHMGGVTIHSWAGIGISAYLDESDIQGMLDKPYLSKRFEKVKVLIIDEVSMLHHFRLDLVDQVLRNAKGNNDAFGGVQVILCGDFFQLPPVSRFGEPESHFIYHSDAWRSAGFTICYLEEQFRQSDDIVISILNEIRSGSVSEKSKKLLHSRIKAEIDITNPTKLFTHNGDVDHINFKELEELKSSEEIEHEMESKGQTFIVETLKKSCLAQPTLKLKVGARVMCVKNNFEDGYVNGTLGTVVSCKKNSDPVIRLTNSKLITIKRASWKIEEEGNVKAEILQYPLRLAWAITVHKSQGMSLDAVEVDLSKSFEPGMGYVALSRVKSLSGLTILGINDMALKVNEEVLEFDEKLKESSRLSEQSFSLQNPDNIIKEQIAFLNHIKPKKKEAKLSTYEETALLIQKKKSTKEIAKTRGLVPETILEHIEKLKLDGEEIDISYLKKEIPHAQYTKICKVFDEIVDNGEEVTLSKAKQKLGANISFFKIRLARIIRDLVPKRG
jgi:ATP-dependent exoDNAse (exonuclease V) alpha subunit